MINKRLVMIGLGLGVTSAVVGMVTYNVAKANKVNIMNNTDRLLDKIEDKVDHVVCSVKK